MIWNTYCVFCHASECHGSFSLSFPSFAGLFSVVNVSMVVIVAVVAVDSLASPFAADIICLLFVL